jgi:hypothetical protein
MTDDCMQQIVSQTKNYEYRRYRIDTSVLRVWFYVNAPYSHIAYICEIDPARTRNPGDEPLVEDGLGNKKFNERHKDWEGNDYAYRIRSVWKLQQPIGLQRMKTVFGVKAAPRGLIYVPATILAHVRWNEQEMLWSTWNEAIPTEQIQPSMAAVPGVANNAKRTRGLIEEESDKLSGKRCVAVSFSC